MDITTKRVKLSEIKLNPDNPRSITEKDMSRLVKSIEDFPEMMKLREIVCDENMMILGGNMRFRALEQQKAKDCTVKIVEGLTDEQKREFVIKDNTNHGRWNYDELTDKWDQESLVNWGLRINTFDQNEFENNHTRDDQKDSSIFKSLKVHFATQKDIASFSELIGQPITDKTTKIWYPEDDNY